MLSHEGFEFLPGRHIDGYLLSDNLRNQLCSGVRRLGRRRTLLGVEGPHDVGECVVIRIDQELGFLNRLRLS